MLKEQRARLAEKLNTSMPVMLDATGLMLLSGSAMMWHTIAGTAAAGLSCFYLNRRVYGGR